VNTNPVESIINWWAAYGKPLRDVTTGNLTILPKDENGAELCLSFHCRGRCFKACHHKGTHKCLSTTSETNLNSFLTTAGVPAL